MQPEERIGRAARPLAEAGPWHIPPETLAIGDSQFVDYVGAGPWIGEEGCYGGISPGTDLFRQYLYLYFPQTYLVGGYSCRPIVGNESQMSVHATGRALDIMIHTVDGDEADNDLGDPIGNWLIENAEAIGIQYIIWDLYTWGAARDPGQKGKPYGGLHPHHDHLHIELSVDVADLTELWFLDAVDPPAIEGCLAIPKEGAIVEESDACFRAFGPNEFWRLIEDAGSGSALLWTNAFESDAPSNWARWNLVMEESGDYQIDVYVDPAWGVHRQTRYLVAHAAGETEVMVDQSAQQGWVSLGKFALSPDAPMWVDVYDHVAGPVEADQHIAVDAVRLTGQGFDPPTEDPAEKTPEESEDPSEATKGHRGNADEGGCSMSSAPPSPTGWGWLAALAFAVGLWRGREAR